MLLNTTFLLYLFFLFIFINFLFISFFILLLTLLNYKTYDVHHALLKLFKCTVLKDARHTDVDVDVAELALLYFGSETSFYLLKFCESTLLKGIKREDIL